VLWSVLCSCRLEFSAHQFVSSRGLRAYPDLNFVFCIGFVKFEAPIHPPSGRRFRSFGLITFFLHTGINLYMHGAVVLRDTIK
jgi:hypothetical protein